MRESAPAISGIVVTRDRAADLGRVLATARAQTLTDFELVVVLNGASDRVAALVREAAEVDPRVVPMPIAETTPSTARNLAMGIARAPLLYFLDDDVVLPPHLFALARARMDADPELGVLGGPNLTAEDEPFFAQVTGALFASRFGAAIARVRYTSRARSEGPATEADLILCNLVVRRSMLASLRFPGLFGGEENVLMGHAAQAGVRMAYAPDLWVHHKRRDTLGGYVEQVFRYGAGRAHALAFAPRTFRVAYFAPVALAIYLAAWPLLALVTPTAHVPALVYATLASFAGAHVALRARRPAFFLPLLGLFPLTHVVYGVGLASRLVALPFLLRSGRVARPRGEGRSP